MSLPVDDPSIDALAPKVRSAIGEVWQKRAESELTVGARFRSIRMSFDDRAASGAVVTALDRAASDEERHSEICRLVAERYTRVSVSPIGPESEPLVRFGDASERISLLLHLVLLSCINEATSTFYLREAMQRSHAKLAHAALRELLSDDVEHARIGWTHLASSHVGAEEKHHVAMALPTLLRLSRDAWTNVRENEESFFRDHGCPGLAVARAAFERAVPSVILPGFAVVGVDPGRGARWFAETA